MHRFQTITNLTVAITQLGHLFCCGLPALFSVLSLLSTFGIAISLPSAFEELHHLMHSYEIPVLVFAGIITSVGWTLHYVSWRIDCRSTGCMHEPCAPKKRRSSKILILSSVLLLLNVLVLVTAHG